jgi:hypothetical protein
MIDERKIYFNEAEHKYTDNLGNVYVSVTTLISKYHTKFDTKTVAHRCALAGQRGNPKYAGKTAKQLEEEWKLTTEEACNKGNRKHNYLEETIKKSNGYNREADTLYINDNLYCVPDIIVNPKFGGVDLDYFVSTGIKDRYPVIYSILEDLISKGYRAYSEIGIYNTDYLISGLIDLLLIKDNYFFIIDWKTNKAPIKYESGYFEKDVIGNMTDNFVYKNTYFNSPLGHLQDSTGNKYALQLSMYAYLTEQCGLVNKGNILCHIRDINEKEVVKPLVMPYMKREIYSMLNHYKVTNGRSCQTLMV